MSQENVEVVRALFEAWNARDMDAFRELYDPEAIMRMAQDWPEPGPYVGREAIMREFEQLRQTWDADTAQPIGDFMDVGDRVAVRHIWRGVGQGPEAEVELTAVWTVREGRIIAADYFREYTEALGALGLRESPMSQENVALQHQVVDAINRRDLGLVLTLMDADVEAVSMLCGMEGEYRGHAGMRRWLENVFDAFPDFAIDVDEVRDLGDLTLTSLRMHGHGADSDTPFNSPLWVVSRWRRGKMLRWRSYFSEAEAVEAAGLRRDG
jgi:ketosteroid isomerase-like protein